MLRQYKKIGILVEQHFLNVNFKYQEHQFGYCLSLRRTAGIGFVKQILFSIKNQEQNSFSENFSIQNRQSNMQYWLFSN
jgi:hypothetical protein